MAIYNEQDKNDAFVKLCGSVKRADRLQQIWKLTYPNLTPAEFIQHAEREGYSAKQITTFLEL